MKTDVAAQHIFVVQFQPKFLRHSFCERGSVRFLPDALSITGDVVPQTLLPLLHFCTFFILATVGTVVASDTGVALGLGLAFCIAAGSVVYVNRTWKGVNRIVPYALMEQVTWVGCRMSFRWHGTPSMISFRVAPTDGERFSREVEQQLFRG